MPGKLTQSTPLRRRPFLIASLVGAAILTAVAVHTPTSVPSASAYQGNPSRAQIPAPAAYPVAELTPAQALGVQSISQSHFAQGGSTVKAAGAYFLHMGVQWNQLAPTDVDPVDFNWSAYDTTLADANSLGYETIVTLGQNPDWAASYERGPIDCVPLSRFTDYVTAVVDRYSVPPYEVKYWAVYNEPDARNQTNETTDCSGDTVALAFGENPDQYVTTLQAGYNAIKAEDPDGIVLLGGIAHDWFVSEGGEFVEEFPSQIFAAGAGAYFDVMNFHFYPNFAPKWENQAGLPGVRAKTAVILDLMDDYGIDKPIIVSEIGESSGGQYEGDPRTEDTQAIAVIQQFTRAIAAGNKVAIWYNMNDYDSPHGFGEHGLLDYPSFEPKLSLDAYETLATHLPGHRFHRVLSSTAMGATDLEGYVFWDTANGKKLTIFWSADGSTQTITLPPGVTSVVDKFYDAVSYTSTLDIDEQPVLMTQDWTFHILHIPLIIR